MFYDNSKELECITELEEQYAAAQRAFDAERANRLAMEACVDRDVKAIKDLKAQLATLQAQLAEERRNVVSMKQWGLDRVAEKNAEIEGYIIQVRTLTESIAMTKDDYKKWKAAEAQLRQVEGEKRNG